MTPVLGLEAGIAAWVLLGGTAVLILVFLVFNPWRTIREEPRLSEEIETRLLLREDFDAIDDAMAPTAEPADTEHDAPEFSPEVRESLSHLDVGEGDE